MAEIMKLVCETCLSTDRRLVATSRIISILKDIHSEELDNKVICWECHSILIKFYRFKIQAFNAQSSLYEKFQNCTTLSNLFQSTKQNYDFEFVHNYNSNTNECKKEEIKTMIKYENDHADDDSSIHHSDYEYDDKKITIVIDSLENSKEEISPKKRYLHKQKSKKKSDTKQCIQELLTTKSFSHKLLSKKNSMLQKKENKMDASILKEKFQTVLLTEDLSKKDFLSQKKEDKMDASMLEENFETVLLTEEISKQYSLSQKKEDKIDSSTFKDKFETILLTEEEMLKSREEKRNHPNYKKIPYKCDTCVLGFTKKDNYDQHFNKKHNEAIGLHICDVCCIRFASAAGLARHRARHFTQFACSLCAYKAAARTAAANHCRDKHAQDERDSIHCKQCAAVFRTSNELSEHTRTDHVLYCKDCGEKFKGQHTLRAHRVRIHGARRGFPCPVCARSFAARSRLEAHAARHSAALARRLAYCAACRVQYKSIQVYRSHLQNSARHATTRYQCPQCNKKFASQIYRTKHINFYHLNKSRHKCDSCNKLFISQWRLKNHRQKHHGLPRSREHECSECGSRFYTAGALSAHGAVHSPARRLLCARCGAQYRQPAALYAHERRAHNKHAD